MSLFRVRKMGKEESKQEDGARPGGGVRKEETYCGEGQKRVKREISG